MNAKEKLKAETIAMLRAVLISSPRGVPFEKLFRDYRQLTGKRIPYKELGFDRLEDFIGSIPTVARAEKGPVPGEWILKGIPSNEDKHVAKLISKQKKPKVRKSAKSFAKRAIYARVPPVRFHHTPVRQKPASATQKNLPPRFQNRNTLSSVSLNRHMTAALHQRQSQRVVTATKPNMSISISNNNNTSTRKVSNQGRAVSNQGRAVSNQERAVSTQVQTVSKSAQHTKTAPARTRASPATTVLTHDTIKWIRDLLKTFGNGLWGSRLCHLYKEKFKQLVGHEIITELKNRPDIARMEEPISGKILIYAVEGSTAKPMARKRSTETQTGNGSVEKSSMQLSIELPRNSSTREVKEMKQIPSITFINVVLPYQLPENGSTVLVYISHIASCGEFYVAKEDASTEELNSMLNAVYEASVHDSSTIPSIEAGQIFCAQFTEDECFYRARILSVVDSSQVLVQYLDFGNKEIIPVQNLRVLDKKFHSQPIQALHCCLDGVQPLDEELTWSDASFKLFCQHSFDKKLKMTVKDIEDGVLSVNLVDEASSTDITEQLLNAGLVISEKSLTSSSSSSSLSSNSGAPSEKLSSATKNGITRSRRLKTKTPGVVDVPDEQFLDVLVCNITGTYKVYLRLVGDEYSKKFESLQESMTLYYNDSTDEVTTDPAPGDLFAMCSEEVWCRVKVTSVTGLAINVFFVDHGDTAQVMKSDLRILATQFTHLPLQVFECALIGLPKTKNPDVVDKLRKLALGEVCVAEVVKRVSGMTFIDLIAIDANDVQISVNKVIRQLVIPDEELKPVLPKVGDTVEVNISYISPTGSVYLHVTVAGTKRLEELNEDLTEHLSKGSRASEFVPKPTTGKLCCARSEDGNWYRARIGAVHSRDAVEVFFVDYGNSDIVCSTNLREPNEVIAHVHSLPFQAIECRLYDFHESDWNEDLANNIMEVVQQGSVTAEILTDDAIPSVSLLVTITTNEGDTITERLTNLLGLSFNDEDMGDAMGSEQVVQHPAESGGTEEANGTTEQSIGVVESSVQDVTNNHVEIDDQDIAELEDVLNELESQTPTEAHAIETGVQQQMQEIGNERTQAIIDHTNETNVQQHVQGIGNERTQAIIDQTSETNVQQHVQGIGNERTQAIIDQTSETSVQQHVQGIGNERSPREVNNAITKLSLVNDLALPSDWFDVFVTEVKDPSHFWFQLLGNLKEFYVMSDKLNAYCQQNSSIEKDLVEGGLYAVYRKDDDCWYRVVVSNLMTGDEAVVMFVDYGGKAIVEVDNIIPLHEEFLTLPFQSVPARLAGVVPKKSALKWSQDCQSMFEILTLNKQLVAKITSNDVTYHFGSNSVTVELCDTSTSAKDDFLGNFLIEGKFADRIQ